MKETIQPILKWTVVGGSAVIAVDAFMKLTKSKSIKEGVMPAIVLLVGVSAFSYAMTADKVGFIPKTSGADGAGSRIRTRNGSTGTQERLDCSKHTCQEGASPITVSTPEGQKCGCKVWKTETGSHGWGK